MDFNPRPPHGGRLIPKALEAGLSIFQSTPSSRRATPAEDLTRGKFDISIHALLTEGDLPPGYRAGRRGISIHALLTEGDQHHLHHHPHQD